MSTAIAAQRAERFRSQARAEFDSWADTYDRSILNHLLFRPSYRVMAREIAEGWVPGDQRRIDLLDVGTGTGTFLEMLLSTSMPVQAVGLDVSPGMCAAASRKAEARGYADRATFVEGDSEHLSWDDGHFDFVTCANSFHHYPHQADVIRELHRVLKPGGRLILVDGYRDVLIGRLIFDVGVAWVEKDVHHASRAEVRQHFEGAGLEVVRQYKFNFLPPILATVGRKRS